MTGRLCPCDDIHVSAFPITKPLEVLASGIGDKAQETSPDFHRIDYGLDLALVLGCHVEPLQPLLCCSGSHFADRLCCPLRTDMPLQHAEIGTGCRVLQSLDVGLTWLLLSNSEQLLFLDEANRSGRQSSVPEPGSALVLG